MTEAEWLNSTDPQAMLSFLREGGRLSDRKARLFAVTCYRRVWDRLHAFTRRVVEVAERHADGSATEEDLEIAADEAWAWPEHPAPEAGWVASSLPFEAADRSAGWASFWAGCQNAAAGKSRATEEAGVQRVLLHCIFGDPFRAVAPHPSWLTPAVLTRALSAYDDRLMPAGALDPARLAALAQALEDAGCTDADLLGHLRGQGPHVRGCWAVDAVLDKH